MLAIAHWTGNISTLQLDVQNKYINFAAQIPRRPPLPDGCNVSQLIALGSRRKKSKVYWMIAKSEQEVR